MTFVLRQLRTSEETEGAGAEFSLGLKPGDIVKITGPLGAGKTTFVRGIVRGLGGDPGAVHSPTFSLVHEYSCEEVDIKHCDFFRLENDSLLEELGGLEFFDSPAIYLLEWPEKIGLWKFSIPNRLLKADLEPDADGRILKITLP